MPLLEVRDLSVTYSTPRGAARAVRGLSFDIEAGETYGLVGESGCGKSTAALAIMRYLPRRAGCTGEIRFNGADLLAATPQELAHLRGNRIAMVYQDPQASLNPVLTIERQLTEVLQAHDSVDDDNARKRAAAMLEQVRMPDPNYVLKRYPHQLSGGMQQRVVIAMALLMRPDLVLMDEPTTGLDVTIEAGILDLINDLRREFRMAVLFISHNLGVIARLCDRVGVMYAGELIEQAPTRDLFAAPQHPYTIGLLRCLPKPGSHYTDEALYTIPGRVPPLTALPNGCAFAPRCALAEPSCSAAPPTLEVSGSRHLVRCFRWSAVVENPALAAPAAPPAPTTAAQNGQDQRTLLSVERLKVYFKGQGLFTKRAIKVIDGIDFTLTRGQTLGIVGESGCGKSTVAATLAGLRHVTEGSIDFNGRDFTRRLEARTRDALRDLQMVFQNPDASLNPRHNVEMILTRPLRCFGIVPRHQERDYLLTLLRAVNLDETYLERKPRQLSGGEKQRVAIARAFAGGPLLVLCDEPISSLDVSVQAAVLNLLQRLQRERGVSLVFIAHDLNVVRYLSDEVAVVYLGKIVEQGPTATIFNPPFHPYTEALISAIPSVTAAPEAARIRLEGSVPSPANPPTGCRFHTRCPRKLGHVCETDAPPAHRLDDGHVIHCHIAPQDLLNLQTTVRS